MSEGRMGLAGTLALLAATIAVVFGVALTRDDQGEPALAESAAQPPPPELDSDELLELVVELAPVVARRVEKIRGLEFDRIPEPQVTDSDELRELAEEEMEKPKVTEKLAASDAALKLLGLLEEDESLATVATDVTANAAAYWDPKEKELFLLGDAVPAGAAVAEFILAHELDHALEDQTFSLPKSSPSSDDSILAESALVEGSATALMMEYATRHLAVSDLITDSGSIEREVTELPDIVEAQVTFSYFGGRQFVDELREAAGGGWDLVDFAYQRRLPATTEQILHPEKYLDDEGALEVPSAPRPGPGWEEADQGAVGEFFTREILRQDTYGLTADEAAAGWGGDHYRFFWRKDGARECSDACRADAALAIVWRGDDEGETQHLAAALEGYVERVLDGDAAGAGAWELDGGWAAVELAGDVVTLAFAPTENEVRTLTRAAKQPID